MELKVTTALDEQGNVVVDNYIITEILDSVDALENPIKVKGESGQHTVESITKNIDAINNQIDELLKTRDKWEVYLQSINDFING